MRRLKAILLAGVLAVAPTFAFAACPTALPPSANFTGSGVTEAQFKVAVTQMRDYLNCLLASTGAAPAAKSALGLAPVASSGDYNDLINAPTQASSVPTGAIFAFAGAVPPTGYIYAAGQAISRTTFAALFSAMGTVYGAGDGFSTFNVPDLRGRAPFGVDAMNGLAANRLGFGAAGGFTGPASLGATAGQQWHVQTIAEMVQHSHSAFSSSSPALSVSGGGVITSIRSFNPGDTGALFGGPVTGGGESVFDAGSIGGSVTGSISTSTTVGVSGSSAASNVTPPALVVTYIIKN